MGVKLTCSAVQVHVRACLGILRSPSKLGKVKSLALRCSVELGATWWLLRHFGGETEAKLSRLAVVKADRDQQIATTYCKQAHARLTFLA